ncbi:hypothetical protein VTK56DRAFT_4125 [Thermocarpiscus australiensis]
MCSSSRLAVERTYIFSNKPSFSRSSTLRPGGLDRPLSGLILISAFRCLPLRSCLIGDVSQLVPEWPSSSGAPETPYCLAARRSHFNQHSISTLSRQAKLGPHNNELR